MEFNVIIYNFNLQKMEPYNIIPHLEQCYNELKVKPKSFEKIKEFILHETRYYFWRRCEYEIILKDWPNGKIEEKWDIYDQIEMNIDSITEIFIKHIKRCKK